MRISGFQTSGNWYRGNLHSHTFVSDGVLSPEAMSRIYKDNGYSFLCISDHDIYTDFRSELNTGDFIILPGIEYSAALFTADKKLRLKLHHIHGILGTEKMQAEAPLKPFKHMEHIPQLQYFGEWDGAQVAQAVVDMLASHGCITTYNHPVWSRVDRDEFVNLKGPFALEIYNFGTVEDSNTGFDTTYWDYMLRRGDRIKAFADTLVVGQRYPVKRDFEAGPYRFRAGEEFIYWGAPPRCTKRRSFHVDGIPVNFMLSLDLFMEDNMK